MSYERSLKAIPVIMRFENTGKIPVEAGTSRWSGMGRMDFGNELASLLGSKGKNRNTPAAYRASRPTGTVDPALHAVTYFISLPSPKRLPESG